MQKFYRLSVNIVKILTLLLAVFLFIGSFLTTCYAENMETQQVLLRFDNPLWNLLELAGYGLLFACCLSLSGKAGAKFRRGLLVFTLGLILLLGGVLIVFGRTVPAADALSVYNAAAEWILGNKDIIHPTVSYLSYYPQQIGLRAFLELLLRLWNLTGLSAPAWHFVKLVYVCLLCVAVLFQYRSLRYLWPDDWEPVSCCYLILVCCNLPMILYSSFVYGEIPSFAMLSVGLFLLLKLLADCIPAHSVETTSPDAPRKQEEYIEKFIEICNYISAHCSDELNLEAVASMSGFSKFYFSRLFKQFTNVSFYKYVNQKRIEKAAEMLTEPNISITNVALSCGFESLSSFIRMFKIVKGCTPTEFRNMYQYC